jgi:hypothetical protein
MISDGGRRFGRVVGRLVQLETLESAKSGRSRTERTAARSGAVRSPAPTAEPAVVADRRQHRPGAGVRDIRVSLTRTPHTRVQSGRASGVRHFGIWFSPDVFIPSSAEGPVLRGERHRASASC